MARRDKWSTRNVGTVDASPDRVRAWWTHSDRKEEWDRLQRIGTIEFSKSEATIDGVFVQTTRFKDGRGWIHEARHEVPVGTDGKNLPSEDGSFPHKKQVIFTGPRGHTVMALTCTGSLQFVEKAGGTEVIETHDQEVTGGIRPWRQRMRRSHGDGKARIFEDEIDRCQTALANANGAGLSEK